MNVPKTKLQQNFYKIFLILTFYINRKKAISASCDSVDQAVNSFDCQWIKQERVSIFIIVLHRVWFRDKCLKQGIKISEFCLKKVGKSGVFVLNWVRV